MVADIAAARQRIVKSEPRPIKPAVGFAVTGNQKLERLHQTGRDAEQRGALVQGVAHQAKIEVLQIPQSAVNQLRIPAAGARCEVILFHQSDFETRFAQNQIARDTRAVDATAHHEHVPPLASKSCQIGEPPVLNHVR